MAAAIQNGMEEEDTFADNFVPLVNSHNSIAIPSHTGGRTYISTSSINENTLHECLGDRSEEGFIPTSSTNKESMRQGHNFLKVNKKEVYAGEDINICWNVTEPCSANDWIGIFKSGDSDPRKFLDHKQRGLHAVKEGMLVWTIPEDCVTDPVTTVCFRYFRASGKIAATSENFYIKKSPQEGQELLLNGLEDLMMSGIVSDVGLPDNDVYCVTINDISASGLRGSMLGPPNPYLKLTVLQHKMGQNEPVVSEHKKTGSCSSTYNPSWSSDFVFSVSPSDSIELEFRDTFGGNSPTQSHFLGKTELWIQDFLTFDFTCTHTLELCKRIPSDHVSGSVTFTVKVSKGTPLSNTASPPPISPNHSLEVSPEVDSIGSSNTGFKVTRIPLNDECPNPDLVRDFTPSPIHFCEIQGYPYNSVRSQREWSISSDVSIRTLEALDIVKNGGIGESPLESEMPDVPISQQLLTSPDAIQTPLDEAGRDSNVDQVEEKLSNPPSFIVNHEEQSNVVSPSSNKSDDFFLATSDVSTPSPVVKEVPTVQNEVKHEENAVLVTPPDSQPTETKQIQVEEETANMVSVSLLVSAPTSVQEKVETKDDGKVSKSNLLLPPSDRSPLTRRVGTLPAKFSSSDVPVVASESSDEDSEREMETQLNLMRSHLRHSRRRYSMRHRKEGPRERRGGEDEGTLERVSALQRSATISGARRAYLKGRYSRKQGETDTLTRDSELSQSQFLEPRVDKHGRTYFMDHKDKTIAYKDENSQSEMAKRRIQLDRRYKSLKRMKGRPGNERQMSPPEDTPTTPIAGVLPTDPESPSTPTRQDEDTSPPPDIGLRPVGRLRTSTTITDEDRQAKATVLAKFKNSQRHATLTDQRRKGRSEGILAALKTASMKKIKRATYSPTGQQEAPVLPQTAEEEDEKKKTSEEAKMQKAVAVEMPGLQFITRKDLYSLINSAGPSAQQFLESRSLMELIQRIRTDPALFLKYQHSPVIIDMCNMFADKTMELPDGWERKLNKDGKAFFVDHNTEKTTYIDPRLPLNGEGLPASLLEALKKEDASATQGPISLNPRRVAGEGIPQRELPDRRESRSPSRGSQGTSNNSRRSSQADTTAEPQPEQQPSGTPQQRLSYNEQVIEFLRQPDIFTTITSRYRRQLKPELKTLIENLRSTGPSGLESQGEHPQMLELIVILSMFEEEISNTQQPWSRVNSTFVKLKAKRERKKKAFEQKLQNFRYTLNHLGYAQNNRFRFNMRRDHLLEDAYEHVMKSRIRHLQRKRLDIQFQGEEGLDYGGPSREFFFLISREIFNPYYGLFEYSANDTYTVQVSPTSCFIENNLDWFKFAGRIIGLAIAQGYLLDVFFTRPMYKSLLNSSPTLKDLEAIEPGIYSSLVWIQENDPEPLDLTFTVEEEAFGQLVEHELKEGGGDIPVTDDNKSEYIELMLRWRLDRGVQEQTTAFVAGFREIIPGSLVRQFDAQELEFVIAGVLEVDVDDWRENTDYRAGYHPDHPVVRMFWKAVESFDNEQRLRLLQFVTGTSSVPFEGFKALKGSSGPKKFNIELWGEPSSLPRSHTCFNRLDLPPYNSYEDLFEKLLLAIEEGGTFGIE
jgi:hypothetical protein